MLIATLWIRSGSWGAEGSLALNLLNLYPKTRMASARDERILFRGSDVANGARSGDQLSQMQALLRHLEEEISARVPRDGIHEPGDSIATCEESLGHALSFV